jgi:DNA segregation ATPase FtsK/SpoIIIE-like protein
MKRFTTISFLVMTFLLAAATQNKASAQGYQDQVSYQTFYDDLQPYGEWIDYPEYGYVWHPDVGGDFRPYSTNGQWVWTEDYGWTWDSYYDWGWATFHYGRWFYDDYYGWLWQPGYEWAPAWVCWRTGGDYYGWAPLGPGFNLSVNVSFGRYSPPANYWCFVNREYIASPRVYNYCVGVQRNTAIINNTTIINNYYRQRNVFVTGPSRGEAERYSREPIRPVAFRDLSRPGRAEFRNNELAIYRPRVVNNQNRNFVPERVQRFYGEQRGNIAGNNGFDRNRRFNNENDQIIRQRQAENNNRRMFDQQRQQQQQQDNMMRQRQQEDNNRRMFEQQRQQQQQQDNMMRQRQQEDNNRRVFEQQRQQQQQQQDQMMRQRQQEDNNRRMFDQQRQQQQQQQDQMMRQRQQEDNNRRMFDQQRQQQFQQRQQQFQQRQQPQQQPQFERRGGFSQQPAPQGGGAREGWRRNG